MSAAKIKIGGMSCMHCVGAVKKALDGVGGVTSATVTVGNAEVSFDESMTSRDVIEKAIIKAGYKIEG